ncbi:MAG TPA: hypothetical protein PLT16_11985, partial [Daejeonella sp.]|nr:hypothetical protein [Daejeonella sp.]
KAIYLWLPFLIVIVPSLMASNFMDNSIINFSQDMSLQVKNSPEASNNLFEPVDCKFDLLCRMNPVNYFKNKTNQVYAAADTHDKIDQIKAFFVAHMTSYAEFLLLILNIIVYILIAKSILYVFSRVITSSTEEYPVTLIDSEISAAISPAVNTTGNKYVISSTDKNKYYFSRKFQPSGYPPKISFPQWNHSPIARLFNGSYQLNEIKSHNINASITFSTTGGREFVEWNLSDGEEIAFDYKDFVGMTSEVTLHTLISFRVTASVLGKVIFSCAKGPGKIILLCKGAPTISEGNPDLIFPVSRLIAYQVSSKFNAMSHLNHLDVLFSEIYLKPVSSNTIVIDSDEGLGGNSGLFRLAKELFKPF